MKTFKDYLIDFDTLKVGDRLWSIPDGECIVTYIQEDSNYNYRIKTTSRNIGEGDASYTKHGERCIGNKAPSLFKEKPDFFKEKKEVKKWKWYFEVITATGVEFSDVSSAFTEEEVKKYIELHYATINKLEKIDCTEITEIVYE